MCEIPSRTLLRLAKGTAYSEPISSLAFSGDKNKRIKSHHLLKGSFIINQVIRTGYTSKLNPIDKFNLCPTTRKI